MTKLKKVLGFPAILLITINSIMGTGIYFLPALGVAKAGPASLISWLLMSVIAIYIGMCFAELCSMFPKAGGVYEYSKHAFGRFPSFLVGWITLVVGNITIAMLIMGAIEYLLPYNLPAQKIGLSLIFIFAFNYIAFRGMKVSAFMLVTFSILTLVIVVSLIIPGLIKFNLGNFSPFFVFPASTIFLTIFFIAETFFGWESATFLAEETKDAEKTMPKALILGTIIIAILAFLIVITGIGAITWQKFAGFTVPLSQLGHAYFGKVGEYVYTLGVYLAIVGAVACWVVSAPRLILALARDRLFLSQFGKIHKKYGTPFMAIILQAIVISLLIITVSGAYRTLLLILIPLALIIYSSVMIALVVLRYKKPELKRPFKVPFGKIGPLIIIAVNITLIITWLTHEEGAFRLLFLGASFIMIGFPLYFLLEMYYDPKMIRLINDLFAEVTLITERFNLPLEVRKEIIKLVGNVKGKTLLEFGCSVGTLTTHLAEEVGPKGKIYATDISKRGISITQRRMDKFGHKHVTTLHDIHHHNRVHPDVPKIHMIVSAGGIGYLKNPLNALREMNKRLKIGSKVCFVDYDKLFDIIPAVEWLEDDKQIKDIFQKSGFKVKVKRKQGFAWTYIYIYGAKDRHIK
ncbi:MAG: amino acid permease [Nanoarchaeota archaeon]